MSQKLRQEFQGPLSFCKLLSAMSPTVALHGDTSLSRAASHPGGCPNTPNEAAHFLACDFFFTLALGESTLNASLGGPSLAPASW